MRILIKKKTQQNWMKYEKFYKPYKYVKFGPRLDEFYRKT